MCGIGGVLGVSDAGKEVAGRLLSALRHRGPDDAGIVTPYRDVHLVQTRLAILDLSPAGHQPMADKPAADRLPNWLVFNGEIYNFKELARELGLRGYGFRSGTDSEVILHSYREWGEQFVERLRGMFALCIVDPARSVAHLYRDRLGIKPLYLVRPAGGGLMFASELKALVEAARDLLPRRINRSALESFLAQGAVQGCESIIDGVTTLEAGGYATFDLRAGRERRRGVYWRLPQAAPFEARRSDAVERLRETTLQAVAQHLVSDAPLGLFLSGGVDSTVLLALAASMSAGPLRTLTIAFDSQRFDESAAAAATAARFEVDHRCVRITGESVLRDFDAALGAMDQPTVDGFNSYFVSRAARCAGLTVALSGLGGDEIFGGYDSFYYVPRAKSLRRSQLLSMCARFGSQLSRTRAAAKLREAVNRDADSLAMYLLRRELFLPDERRSLHPLPANSDSVTGLDVVSVEDLRARAESLEEINRISQFEIELYLRNMLLRDADVFSMAAPIEYRVPFLDHRLVEIAFTLPGQWKMPDPRPKPLLLDVADDRVPEPVWKRRKQGFTFPWADWLRPGGAMAAAACDAVADSSTWKNLGFEARAVAGTWNRFAAGDRRISALQILAFITLRSFCVRHRVSA